jgi:hypothetical protein
METQKKVDKKDRKLNPKGNTVKKSQKMLENEKRK